MAVQEQSPQTSHDYEAHLKTYRGFVRAVAVFVVFVLATLLLLAVTLANGA